ncbi:hypothetical protein [Gordonia rubripertincta]|uniref:hypothetical protein n=1 Tax=Gordonia rubripertincta TaxID=36822 RepID=UPI0015F895B1|nr:hypothetical protein [Gordonia rubripertincta]QMU19335.1 hypothetical protein H3V45_14675 [Gordonia rubripertincta]
MTANPLYTTPAPEAARDYTQHTARRDNLLRGTNHAGQIAWHCNTCHNTFDVGHERFLHPSFIARCWDCTVKEKTA